MSREIYQKIAHHFGELRSLYAQLASEPPLVPITEAVKCDCGKLAATSTGKASSGPKKGLPFIRYYCADNKCDFKKFEDA
jgi:hypothetical protein